jgi:hypothetical protein
MNERIEWTRIDDSESIHEPKTRGQSVCESVCECVLRVCVCIEAGADGTIRLWRVTWKLRICQSYQTLGLPVP